MSDVPRKFFFFLLVAGVLSWSKAGAGSYPEEGPFYQVPYVVAGPAVQVSRIWMPAGSDQVTRKHNFVVPLSFQAPTPGSTGMEGRVQFGRPVRLLDDPWRVWTRVISVRGTDLIVQVQDDYRRRITVSVLDHAGGHRELANFPHEAQNANDGAVAITRSGRHVLLAGPDKITLWDLVNWREEKVDGAKDLLAIRAALMKGTGNPGQWWLTDDLRYIIVDTTGQAWRPHGEGPVYADPFEVAGLKLDTSKDAVVFDRKSGTLSVFESHIPSPVPGTFRIADAENVGGHIWLLYLLNIDDARVAIADTEGHVRASHTVSSYTARLAGWDPERDEVWIQMRDGNGGLPNDHPDADHHLIAWNVGKDTERRFKLPVDQIRKVVENGK
jgi:hypothetical protein